MCVEAKKAAGHRLYKTTRFVKVMAWGLGTYATWTFDRASVLTEHRERRPLASHSSGGIVEFQSLSGAPTLCKYGGRLGSA
eukprot:3119410-Amphidinium_carterae.1